VRLIASLSSALRILFALVELFEEQQERQLFDRVERVYCLNEISDGRCCRFVRVLRPRRS
jgi:hypothetical protein